MSFDSLNSFFLENELQDGKKFETHQDLLQLITTIHESYHVMQNMLLGTCIWYQHAQDKFSGEMAKACQRDPSKTGAIKSVRFSII